MNASYGTVLFYFIVLLQTTLNFKSRSGSTELCELGVLFFVQFKQPYVILSGRCPHVDYPTLTDFDRSPNSWVKLQSQTSKGWTVRLFWVKDVTCFNNSSSIIICWPKSKYFENISAVFVSIVYIGYCNGSSFYHVESLGYFCWSIWAW